MSRKGNGTEVSLPLLLIKGSELVSAVGAERGAVCRRTAVGAIGRLGFLRGRFCFRNALVIGILLHGRVVALVIVAVILARYRVGRLCVGGVGGVRCCAVGDVAVAEGMSLDVAVVAQRKRGVEDQHDKEEKHRENGDQRVCGKTASDQEDDVADQ